MMLHGAQPPPSALSHSLDMPPVRRKRKAESQDNERLSKRLSLLNLEQNGSKLYVPVEAPTVVAQNPHNGFQPSVDSVVETMQMDDSKHKVYIYNIDDELSDENDVDEGKLVFLPNIEKHLREHRIPPHILANSDGELAGMQLVLYNEPKSISVPEEMDSVRKAIADARRRHREKSQRERLGLDPIDVEVQQPIDQPMDAEPIDATADADAMDMD